MLPKKRYLSISSLMMPALILAACTVTTSTPIDPHPSLTEASASDEAFRCEVRCDVHEDFAANGLTPEQARTALDRHNADEHNGGTNHTSATCEPAPLEK